MFTVKVFRSNSKGDERVDLYQTMHPEVFSRDRGMGFPPSREVRWRDPDTDEWPVVVLNPDDIEKPPNDGTFIARHVVIENADGKTTDVVRVSATWQAFREEFQEHEE